MASTNMFYFRFRRVNDSAPLLIRPKSHTLTVSQRAWRHWRAPKTPLQRYSRILEGLWYFSFACFELKFMGLLERGIFQANKWIPRKRDIFGTKLSKNVFQERTYSVKKQTQSRTRNYEGSFSQDISRDRLDDQRSLADFDWCQVALYFNWGLWRMHWEIFPEFMSMYVQLKINFQLGNSSPEFPTILSGKLHNECP